MLKIYMAILIGLPGVGKTTFCRKILENNTKFNIVHVCFDDYILVNSDLSNYKNYRKKLINEINTLIDSIKVKSEVTDLFLRTTNIIDTEADFLILIDDNNYYRGMRYEFYKIAKNNNIAFIQLYFLMELTETLNRNRNRITGCVPDDVIKSMNEKLEIPSIKAYWENRTFIINKQNCIECDNILYYIGNTSNIPMSTMIKVNSFNQTKIHKIDLALRQHIKNLITENRDQITGKNIKVIAEKLNNKRKSLLQDLRSSVLNLNDNTKNFLEILTYEYLN